MGHNGFMTEIKRLWQTGGPRGVEDQSDLLFLDFWIPGSVEDQDISLLGGIQRRPLNDWTACNQLQTQNLTQRGSDAWCLPIEDRVTADHVQE